MQTVRMYIKRHPFVQAIGSDVPERRGAVNLLPTAAPPEAGAIVSGEAGGARRVPVLSLRVQGVKRSGPTRGKQAKEVGPLGWRAIQDSNLWPSAPEANVLEAGPGSRTYLGSARRTRSRIEAHPCGFGIPRRRSVAGTAEMKRS